MKWFKHISDSLDDPFIFNLMTQCGSDGYLVFFGILEIYSREFKPELGWKLSITRAYLKQKLCKRQDTLIIKSLELIKNSGKWIVEFDKDNISIFIPKFTDLLDNYTKNTNPKISQKLASDQQETFQPIRIKNKEEDKDKEAIIEETALEKEFREIYFKVKEIFPHLHIQTLYQNYHKKHPEALLKGFNQLIINKDTVKSPFRYVEKIIEDENKNFNARDSERECNEFKKPMDLVNWAKNVKSMR